MIYKFAFPDPFTPPRHFVSCFPSNMTFFYYQIATLRRPLCWNAFAIMCPSRKHVKKPGQSDPRLRHCWTPWLEIHFYGCATCNTLLARWPCQSKGNIYWVCLMDFQSQLSNAGQARNTEQCLSRVLPLYESEDMWREWGSVFIL